MKILAIADEESPALWEYYVPGRLKEYDLIISCGDLSAKYLEFLATMGRSPVIYVPGNHDVRYVQEPPEGVGDGEDNAHRGFESLLKLIDKYHPTYLLHGHVHANYDSRFIREREYHGTKVINVGERYTLEVPEETYKPKDYFQVKYKTRQKKELSYDF